MAIKIYIDQGHNPRNPNSGAEGNGLQEADLTYTIGILTAELLADDPNFEVRTSRTDPDQVLGTSNAESLAARVNDANSWGADWFISLHANASTIPTASGCEGYVYDRTSRAFGLAEDILTELNLVTGLRNRGVIERPGLYVLRRTNMPAVLVEMGFITNPTDAELMAYSPELFARGIYRGILKYYGNA